ncbi:MAG: hypothetical protein LBT65_01955 [Synergistaceae bacterium]|jgi:uncharacterized protein YgbK (DUF1537 family)|nr:hypothetical protein [Synergistaceae bacterium]
MNTVKAGSEKYGVTVVADDLTGAADTGIRFAPVVDDMWLSPSTASSGFEETSVEGIAVFTDSRRLDAAQARRAVREGFEVAGRLNGGNGGLVYKKIDSTLRGQIGAEVSELLELTGKRVALVAPTSVEQGRTVHHGLLRMHGVPVAETELGRDPITPMRTSNIVDIVAGPEKLAVRLLDIPTLSRGREALFSLFESWLSEPCVVACEAVDREHLEILAELATRPECLPAGSAGLAGAIVELLTSRREGAKNAASPGAPAEPFTGRTLWLCGTASAVTREQAAVLAAGTKIPTFTLSEGETRDREALSRWLREPLRLMAPSDAEVLIRVGDGRMSSAAILTAIQAIARKFADELRVENFFLSGGDTAHALLSGLESYPLRLEEELLPGLIRSRNPRTRQNFFTKAGAFGEKDTLLRLHRYLSGK